MMQGTPPDDSFDSKLLERMTELEDSLETLELHDFQTQISRLSERITALEQENLRLRRGITLARVIILESQIDSFLHLTLHVPQLPSTVNSDACANAIRALLARIRGRLDNSDNPEDETNGITDAINQTLQSYRFPPIQWT